MKQVFALVIGALLSSETQAVTNSKADSLKFVFEMTRHGARAPGVNDYGFVVGDNQLTAQGMRQRFLLGDYNRKRYVEEYGLLDEIYNPNQIEMQTTISNRTFQSGYSELMGMYPPTADEGSKHEIFEHQVMSIRTMPSTFKVRDQEKLVVGLGYNSLPYNVANIPIFSHVDQTNIEDDLDLKGCNYVNDVDGYRFPSGSTYVDYEWLMNDLREPISDMFNLTYEQEMSMTSMDLYNYCDVIQSRLFEGVPLYYTFTEDQLTQCNQTVLATLVEPMADPVDVRDMYISKQLRRAHYKMQEIVDGNQTDELKFLSYSTHDWTIAQHLLWNNATNGNFTVVPYASNVAYELHQTELTQYRSSYWVEIRYNGMPYGFDHCKISTKCTWDEFEKVVSDSTISSTTQYQEECATPWSPPIEQS